MRYIVVSLTLLLAPGCDILSPPDGELVLMVTTGHFSIVPDTVRVSTDQRLLFINRLDVDVPTDDGYAPDVVFMPYTQRKPELHACVRGEPSPQDMQLWGDPPTCDEVWAQLVQLAKWRKEPPPDSMMLLTPELRELAAPILPCAAELNPEAALVQGAFRECISASWKRIGELGPGLVHKPTHQCGASCLYLTACGWTWATYRQLDGWKRPWPEPFAGEARVEIEVGC